MVLILRLNPFRAGRCLSTHHYGIGYQPLIKSQSLSSRAMSFDLDDLQCYVVLKGSQSLSSRAMSFDITSAQKINLKSVSIPFEQGDVFRLMFGLGQAVRSIGLNPFRAGRCLSTYGAMKMIKLELCLNPFRAGRCLST